MLQLGRIDFWVEEETTAFDTIHKVFPGEVQNFKALQTNCWPLGSAYMIASKKFPNAQSTLEKFNKGLAKIKKNGTYKKITANYNMTTK
jgi:ABC-type amino acid transport substrate-binding protein